MSEVIWIWMVIYICPVLIDYREHMYVDYVLVLDLIMFCSDKKKNQSNL